MGIEGNIAFAALDIGTSQIKLGVYCPLLSRELVLVDNFPNELLYGNAGQVAVEYSIIRDRSFSLFKKLGQHLKTKNVQKLYIGICGHISSLIEWDQQKGLPPETSFPIWLDTTSQASLEEYNSLMGNGKSREIIGTFLPAGTNWLLTKLLDKRTKGFKKSSIFLQVGDTIFYELCGTYKTHFSSPLSMVNLDNKEYAPALLEYLGLDRSFFPVIDYDPWPVNEAQRNLFDFPMESFVFPAMADLYSSLYGLRLHDREGFMLANTSEQAGAFYKDAPPQLDHFLNISFNGGFINYGSTNTGGNIVNWFLTHILNKKVTPEILDEMVRNAREIAPENTPVIMPYIQGERAPLWNPGLTASFHEMRSVHTGNHLFRAILESVSFARKQCFEEIGIDSLHLIKIAGGSSKNLLWNSIRATVLNKNVAVADEKELSMAGLVYYIMERVDGPYEKPPIRFSIVEPVPDWVQIYEEKYKRFIQYQQWLS